MSKSRDPMVAALLREREGYLRRGRRDRVKQVDEQLAQRGYKPDDDADDEQPTGRSTPQDQQSTAAPDTARRRGRPRRDQG